MKVRSGFWPAVLGIAGTLLWGLAYPAEPTYGPVRPGDTLWGIAGRVYAGAELGRDRIMLALVLANPAAFEPACNPSGILKAGATLRLPPAERIAVVDEASARIGLRELERAWQAHRRGGPTPECPTERFGILAPGAPPAEQRVSGTEPMQAPPTGPTAPTPPPVPPGVPASGAPGERPTPAEAPQPEAPGPRETTACPEPAPPTETSPASPPPSPPLLTGDTEGRTILPAGPRAPGWLLAALLLALVSASMVRWERRNALAALWRSPSAALSAAAQLPKRTLIWLAPGGRELYLLLLLAALGGFLGALVTILFREGIHGLQWLTTGHSGGLVNAALTMPAWQRLLLPALGGLAAGLVLERVGQRLAGPRTTDYMEAVAIGDGWISVRHSLVKAVSSLLTVSTGGSIGREGAMVQLAAMVASVMARLSHLPRDSMRFLVAAGAAAGLASAYNAPIAATVFVAEIVLGSIAIDHIGPLIVAAVIANATVHDLLGYAPVYEIPEFQIVSDWELVLYLALGLVAGHTAPVFLRLLERSHRFFSKLPMALTARMALGGLIVGAISIYEPQVWGNGYSVVNSVLHAPWAWQALLTVMILKMLATAAVYGSGAVGGAFTPTLCVGALLGALFGTLVHGLLPTVTGPPNAYAVVGMGAMLAGTIQAPLMAILMALEMTMDYRIVLPLMLAVIVAHYTARRYTEIRPMYAESLLPRSSEA